MPPRGTNYKKKGYKILISLWSKSVFGGGGNSKVLRVGNCL